MEQQDLHSLVNLISTRHYLLTENKCPMVRYTYLECLIVLLKWLKGTLYLNK